MSNRLMLGLVVATIAGTATAQTPPMTVRQFVDVAGSAPRNPLAMMRPFVRRAWDTMEGSINAARAEEARARASRQTPPFCIPATTNISPNDFVSRMRAVSAAQQDQSVNRAVRSWMIERFPCP